MIGIFAAISPLRGEAVQYKSPCDILISEEGNRLYVLNHQSDELMLLEAESGKIEKTFPVGSQPNSMVLLPGTKSMLIASGSHEGKIQQINLENGKVEKEVPAGHTPCGLSLSKDGKTLLVCNRFSTDISLYSLPGLEKTKEFPGVREPRESVITPDGKTAFVVNFLPNDPADSYDVAAEITMIDLSGGEVKNIRLPNGSGGMHGICVSPDGKYVYAAGLLARYQLPTTQVERGWMNTSSVNIIDAQSGEFINAVLLDDVDRGAANPWGITLSEDGSRLYVAIAGTHELCVIETEPMLKKLREIPKTFEEARARGLYDDRGAASSIIAADVPNDLAFLVGMKKRIRLPGNGPRELAAFGNRVYLGMYFSDTLAVLDLNTPFPKPRSFPLGREQKLTEIRKGEMYWNDATFCFQNWQSCASCHPDARADALNWDLLNDGIGNPKNAKSLLQSHLAPPAMWTGVRVNSAYAIRTGFRHILFTPPDERTCDEIDAYLHSMEPEKSPYLVKGELSESAKRGKVVFEKVSCDVCHYGDIFTDKKLHDVNSKSEIDRVSKFDTPSLIEVWRTGPYLHDGRYDKMRDVFAVGKHGEGIGDVSGLTEKELDDLTEYVLSL